MRKFALLCRKLARQTSQQFGKKYSAKGVRGAAGFYIQMAGGLRALDIRGKIYPYKKYMHRIEKRAGAACECRTYKQRRKK